MRNVKQTKHYTNYRICASAYLVFLCLCFTMRADDFGFLIMLGFITKIHEHAQLHTCTRTLINSSCAQVPKHLRKIQATTTATLIRRLLTGNRHSQIVTLINDKKTSGLFVFFCLNLLKNKYIFDGRMYYVQLRSEEEYLNLGAQQADTTGLLDLVLSLLGEVLGLHDDGTSGQMATTQQLVVALKEKGMKTNINRILFLLKSFAHRLLILFLGSVRLFSTREAQFVSCIQSAHRLGCLFISQQKQTK